MNLRDPDKSFFVTTAVAVTLAVASFALVLWLILGGGTAKGADVGCLSKSEARAKYPRQVIYWHTIKHCWDNVPVRQYHARARPNRVSDANGNPAERRAVADAPTRPPPSVFYPPLMAGTGTAREMLYPHDMASWPLVTDFDVELPVFIPWQKRFGGG